MPSRERKGGFREAAVVVLTEAGAPLHSNEITKRALAKGLIETAGKTPEDTMHARIATSIVEHGDAGVFVRTAPGTFGLRAWVLAGTVKQMESAPTHRVRVPEFPTYAQVRALLPVFVGRERAEVTALHRAVTTYSTDANESLDWSEPETWVPQRLDPDQQALALAVWKRTRGTVNPRYILGSWLLASGYDLVADDPNGKLALTSRGEDFAGNPRAATAQELDEAEGLARLLALVAEHGPATTADLAPHWKDHLDRVSRIRSEAAARSAMTARLRNLAERELVERTGRLYSVTKNGLAWLGGMGVQADTAIGGKEDQDLWALITRQKDVVRDQMRSALTTMDPYEFERLIGRLLEEMGYSDVAVTAPSNDKGVDVVASIELGISSVREVVQAKRHQANIGRPVLDQLRGSLHRFKAVRGTIITTGDFSKGTREAAFEVGVAPITLINGEKLVEMLIEYGVGVRKREVMLLELDRAAFAPTSADE